MATAAAARSLPGNFCLRTAYIDCIYRECIICALPINREDLINAGALFLERFSFQTLRLHIDCGAVV